MGFVPSWRCPKRPRARLAGRCLSLGSTGLLSQGSTAPSALLGERGVMKSGISVRKLLEKGGANGLRPCRGSQGETRAGKRPRGQRGQRGAAPGVQGRAGGQPHHGALRHCCRGELLLPPLPGVRAWSCCRKSCLPAVRSLVLTNIMQDCVF